MAHQTFVLVGSFHSECCPNTCLDLPSQYVVLAVSADQLALERYWESLDRTHVKIDGEQVEARIVGDEAFYSHKVESVPLLAA